MLVQHGGEVASSYGAEGTPVAVLVTPKGKIAFHVARGAAEIHVLTIALRTVSSLRGYWAETNYKARLAWGLRYARRILHSPSPAILAPTACSAL